jgi:sugar phosphate isomerase/epimerase|tara:strand:+ start:1736 stop:2752 length:1017 start_codon:yes stop_codon:yes gene_type:complete
MFCVNLKKKTIHMNNRRSFIKTVAAGSLGSALVGCENVSNKQSNKISLGMKRNPIGVSTYSFWQFNGRETPIEYCIDKSAEYGFDGVELLLIQMESEENSYLQKIKKQAFHSGLDIMGLSTHQSFVSPDKNKRLENVKLTQHQIEVAYSLGIPTIRINTGRWGTTNPQGNKSAFDVLMDNKGVESVINGYTEDDGFKWVIDSIEKCIPTAEKCGVVLGLENHWGLGLTSQGVMRIVNEINSPWLKVTLDTGNFFDNREKQLEELAPHTCLIQAKTYFGGAKWPAFNEINIDYPAIGELMRENNYRGYISLEFEGNEDAKTAVPKSLELLRDSFYFNLT